VPVIEFRCEACGKRFSALVRRLDDARCSACGSARVTRLISRFARARSEDDRLIELADRFETFGEPDSPHAVREALRDAGKAMDEDLSDELIEAYEEDSEV
jgi:putative FmdB family regulatory protein